MSTHSQQVVTNNSKEILYFAAFFGLITGLSEGIILYLLQINNLLFWRLSNRAIWIETLWISPVFDFLLFGFLGALLVIIGRVFNKLPVNKIAIMLFSFMFVFDLLFIFLIGRVSIIAILVLALGIASQLGIFIIKKERRFFSISIKGLPVVAGLAIMLLVIIQAGKLVLEQTTTSRLPAAKPETPNVLVIIIDALRADHLSSYGYSRNTSPNIDRIAQEGSLFENAIAPSSWTQPSHASLLTGRYTYEHQAELAPLDDRFQTIGEALQEQGYRTGAVSANLFFFTRRQGFGRGFAHFEDHFQTIPDMASNTLYGYIIDYYFLRKILNYEEPIYRKLADDVTDSALRWIQKDTQKPYFLFINYFDAHDPYTPPNPYRTQFSSMDNPGGEINSYIERYSPELTSEQLQGEIDAYDGSVLFIDDQIEILLNGLRESGQLDNTIVMITSDHGESFGEHGLLQHSNSLYIEQIRVPLIIWWPGKIPANNRVNLPVSISALPATILSLVNGDSGTFPGPALDTLAQGQAAPGDFPDPISELEQFTGAADQNPSTHGELKSVISSDLQYIIHETFGEELYDWRRDPQEMVNLAGESDQQSIMDEFRQYLENLVGAVDF